MGETLAADTSGIADADGLSDVSYAYQWIRTDGGTDTDIAGATDSTYTLTNDDQGKTIKLKVWLIDDNGNSETLTSAATAAVASRPNTPATGLPTISGTVQVDQTLTADTSGITDADGLSDVSYAYRWIRTDGGAGASIAGATDSTYTLTVADEGKTIKVRVSFTDDAGNEETLTSAATATVAARPNSPATGLPTISGTVQVDETLTADTSGISDADGLTNVSYSYQWIRNDGTNDSDIGGQTGSTYTLVSADEGKTIKVKVSFTDDADDEETLTSAATAAVAAAPSRLTVSLENAATTHDGSAVFTFEIRFSEELALSYATLKFHAFDVTGGEVLKAQRMDKPSNIRWLITVGPDVNGDVTVVLPVTEDCAAQGAICTEDGRPLSNRLQLTVTGPLSADQNTEATGAPTISGTAQVDETLTADVSSINDSDGLTNVSYSYQWIRNDGTNDADIGGQTGSTYTLTDEDVGKSIKVKVSFTDDAGNEETLTSAATAAVAAKPNAPATGAPTISGTAQVDETLTADTSGITDADGLDNAEFSYQWIRTDGGTDDDIAGATESTYTLTDDDEGKTIKLKVWFIDDKGNSETLTSAATADVGEPQFLVSNLGAGVSGAGGIQRTLYTARSGFAQAFTTGAKTGGYPLGSVGIQVSHFYDGSTVGDHLQVTINGVASEGEPGDAHCTLTNPSSFSTPGVSAFEAPTGAGSCAQLATETTYFVVIEWVDPSGTDHFALIPQTYPTEESAATEEDPGGAEGWSIADQSYYLTVSSNDRTWTAYDQTASFKIVVKEAAVTAAKANSPATGAPAISGTVQAGQTLTADTSGITDADGLTNVSYSYQWIRSDNGADTDIAGETDSTYTLVLADLGKAIEVQVTFTDDDDNAETLTSVATEPVSAAANNPATGVLTISGTVQVGEALTADTSGIDDADGLTNVSYSYQWLADDADIQGDTGSTYTLTDDDVGKVIKVKATFTDDAGNEESLTSGATAEVEARPNSPATGAPAISGTVQAGETLTADTSGITDADGLTNVTYSYQWLADDSDIGGETASTYAVSDDAVGKAISVRVTFTDNAGNEESLTSGATAEVEARPNSPATGAPAVSGTVQAGQTLTADTSGITDADGLTNVSYSYQWLDEDADIAGETASTYTLTDDVVGKVIKVKVTFTDDAGNEESLTSEATEPVSAAANNPATGVPTISGTVRAGETLTADTSGITDADGLSNVSYSYQWLADDSDIAGETASTYTLSDDDVGKGIKVKATFTDNAGNEESLISGATAEVTARPNSPATGAPAISGTAQAGETLTADTSGITDADGLTNVSYSYQWLADDSDIAGETASTYTLTDDDVGKVIKVKATFTDNAGNEESLTSEATAEVTARPNSPATGAPAISGTVQAGETLTADTSGITDANGLTNVTFSYQWLADDADIQDATGSTYTLTDDDVGKVIKVKATFTDDAGNEESLTSEATAEVIARPNSPATGAPTISGTAQAGETLTADTSGITDANGLTNVTYSYQWLDEDADIAGETASTYTLTDDDVGKAISVRVTFTDNAGNEESLTSEATAEVEARPNSPATGAPTISGTVRAGETLTADTSGITDADGLTNVSYSYQWLADDADIQDATGSTYTLTDDDVGKAISVRATFTDDRDNEESLTSEATAEVEARPNTPATGAPTISGTAQAGETLTADTSGIDDADGLTNVAFSYQWLADDADIQDATGSTYTLTDDDVGKAISVRATFTDDRDNEESLTSEATAEVEARPNTPATGAPTISGTAQAGETLTADTSGIDDADGLTNVAFSYQWLADDADIQDATGSTYTLTDDDVGKAISVRATFTDDRDNEELLTSEATAEVEARPDSPDTDTPPSDTGTTVEITVGDTVAGDIAEASEVDWFKVRLLASETYRIDMRGAWGGAWAEVDGKIVWVSAGTLEDPKLLGVFGEDNALVPGTDEEESGNDRGEYSEGKNSRITSFSPPADGYYYIAAAADGAWTGTYEFTVTVVTDE